MLDKIGRYFNSKITFDMYLKSLNTPFRPDTWESGTGWIKAISDDQYMALNKLTNLMTSEELRNPQLISDERIKELATISNISENEIKIHFLGFEINHRTKLPKDFNDQMEYIKQLAKEKGIHIGSGNSIM